MIQQNNKNHTPNNIRLNRYLSKCGIASRRKAEHLIQNGKIKVNGKTVTDLSTTVGPADKVIYKGKPLKPEPSVYILMNKPKNALTTKHDPQNRPTIFDWLNTNKLPNIFPVGRLDRNTSGVILLTNDGSLANRLTHPGKKIEKVYHVTLNKPLPKPTAQAILKPHYIDNDYLAPDSLTFPVPGDKQRLLLGIHSGQNRIVRRMFKTWGYHVKNLDRLTFAGIAKHNLKPGAWRYLKDREVRILRNKAGL